MAVDELYVEALRAVRPQLADWLAAEGLRAVDEALGGSEDDPPAPDVVRRAVMAVVADDRARELVATEVALREDDDFRGVDQPPGRGTPVETDRFRCPHDGCDQRWSRMLPGEVPPTSSEHKLLMVPVT